MKKVAFLCIVAISLAACTPVVAQTKKNGSFFSSLFSKKKSPKQYVLKTEPLQPRMTQAQGIDFKKENQENLNEMLVPDYVLKFQIVSVSGYVKIYNVNLSTGKSDEVRERIFFPPYTAVWHPEFFNFSQ